MNLTADRTEPRCKRPAQHPPTTAAADGQCSADSQNEVTAMVESIFRHCHFLYSRYSTEGISRGIDEQHHRKRTAHVVECCTCENPPKH
ncbi:hypothetical protein PRUPE_4G190900 [Prunus persica]|uniref:Uncharacterized protein n=1 Tax=Prunus persica TaxID=3760 RepID=A0A251PMW3_PRUPE|nr:hypothetical protein PRUPE_4G190900 [Prunus persica]